MNPKIPGILAQVITAGEKTLAQSSGDARRIEALEALHDLVALASDWPTDQRRRYVNEWTVLFVRMLRRIERLHPGTNDEDAARATAIACLLLPAIRFDAGCALEVLAGGAIADAPARGRGGAG